MMTTNVSKREMALPLATPVLLMDQPTALSSMVTRRTSTSAVHARVTQLNQLAYTHMSVAGEMTVTEISSSVHVNMDMTKESTTSSKEDIKIIKLLVRQDQTVLSEGKVYDDSELLSMLNIAIKDADKYSIILTSKDDVTYQRFLNLMSFLKTNDLNNVTIGLKKNEISK